jgi:hypothetical protein
MTLKQLESYNPMVASQVVATSLLVGPLRMGRNFGAVSSGATWSHVHGFIGYYDVAGPHGYVEASDPIEAILRAKVVAAGWPKAKVGTPHKRWFKKSTYRVKIWTE